VTDPFHTAAVRQRVLRAWADSPARLREDANAEDDARTAHADRVVVELAQNAADAATAAGVPGRLRLEQSGGVLLAANAGAPLDAGGVESLSALRVSPKRGGTVGRFGVGFKAVLALTDEPAVLSRAGGVRWSAAETASALAGLDDAGVDAVLDRRGGMAPVLRLPFPAEPAGRAAELLATGWDTVVQLPLRDAAAGDRLAHLLSAVDPLLLLALPGLEEITVDAGAGVRRLHATRTGPYVLLTDGDATTRWAVHTSGGEIPAALLADRPVEERERSTWSVTWAVPVDGDGVVLPAGAGDRRVRAPQPLAERVDLPAVLIASLPVDPTRSGVAPGPLTDELLTHAADGYVALLESLPATPELLELVPATLPAGPVDLALRERLRPLLQRARLLPSALDATVRLRGEQAGVLDLGPATKAVTTLLAPHLPGLVGAAFTSAPRRAALLALGVRELSTSDLVEVLHTVVAEPEWWAQVYAALRDAPDRDALRGLPVPLADGRVASGPRGVLLPAGRLPGVADLLSAGVALRVAADGVAAGAAATTLLLLGAREAEVASVLDDPELRLAVEHSLDADPPADPAGLAGGVLSLVAADPAAARERPWLGDLALPSDDGDELPAAELVLPTSAGGRLPPLLADDTPLGVVAPELVRRHGVAALTAVGVLATFPVVRAPDVLASADAAEHDLDGEEEYLAAVGASVDAPPGVLAELVAVRDLDLVAPTPAAWAAALAELATPELRAAVVEPARVTGADGRSTSAPSYAAWWLRTRPCVPGTDGELHRPAELARDDAPHHLRLVLPEVGVLDEAAAALVAAVGAVGAVTDLSSADLVALLDRLPAAAARLDREALRRIYTEVAAALAGAAGSVDLPEQLLAERSGALVVVARDETIVVDRADLTPLLPEAALVPVALRDAWLVADVLGVRVAGDLAAYAVRSDPAEEVGFADLDVVAGLVARLRLEESVDDVVAVLGGTYLVHDGLLVDDLRGRPVRVGWRVADDAVHVDRAAGVWALSRAIAAQLGLWSRRDDVAVFLGADQTERVALLAEALSDPPSRLFQDED
jgi:hypothetical protein